MLSPLSGGFFVKNKTHRSEKLPLSVMHIICEAMGESQVNSFLLERGVVVKINARHDLYDQGRGVIV